MFTANTNNFGWITTKMIDTGVDIKTKYSQYTANTAVVTVDTLYTTANIENLQYPLITTNYTVANQNYNSINSNVNLLYESKIFDLGQFLIPKNFSCDIPNDSRKYYFFFISATPSVNISSLRTISYLIVGGGGSGGSSSSNGFTAIQGVEGLGGSFIEGVTTVSYIGTHTFAITVGGGGNNSKGGNSSIKIDTTTISTATGGAMSTSSNSIGTSCNNNGIFKNIFGTKKFGASGANANSNRGGGGGNINGKGSSPGSTSGNPTLSLKGGNGHKNVGGGGGGGSTGSTFPYAISAGGSGGSGIVVIYM
jgi:hypothetical protein